MMDECSPEETTILSMKPGDILVLKYPDPLTQKQADKVRATISQILPADCNWMVLHGGVTVSVLREGENPIPDPSQSTLKMATPPAHNQGHGRETANDPAGGRRAAGR